MKISRGRSASVLRTGWGRWLWILFLCGLVGAAGCGRLRPRPTTFDPQSYRPITYKELLTPDESGLRAGEKVRVKAYFWQYVDYDPALVRNYLTLLRYPIRWYRLRWFALYRTDDLRGYYDLAAMTPGVAARYKLTRLEPVLLYGELSQLGTGLFFQVFHVEQAKE